VAFGDDFGDLGRVYRLDPATFVVTTIHRFDGHDGSEDHLRAEAIILNMKRLDLE